VPWTADIAPPSLWLDRPEPPLEVETAVVGGGFVGLSAAWWLARAGRRAVVLEAGALAGRASGRNSGALLTGAHRPLAGAGDERARAASLALWHAARESRELLRRELLDPGRVDCGFLAEGSWIAALHRGQEEELRASFDLLRAEGFDVEWRDAAAAREASGSPLVVGAIHQPRDGGLDPVKLCRGLAADGGSREGGSRDGGSRDGGFEVRTGFRVRAVEPAGERVRLVSEAGAVLAERTIFALNAYAPRLLPPVARLVRPVRGQMLATGPGERFLRGVWSLDGGFEYARQLADGTFLLGGKRSAAVDVEIGYLETPTATVQGALDRFLDDTFPRLAGRPVRHRWAGTLAFTEDGLPAVGVVPGLPGAFYAAGFCGHGMSLGFAAGRHLARAAWGEADAGDFPAGRPRAAEAPAAATTR
jgi:glycine/D-amino acid oxidase-like deaminating enzyme